MDYQLALAGIAVAALAMQLGLTIGARTARAQLAHDDSPEAQLAREAKAELAREQLAEVNETMERRRKRLEQATRRAEQREQRQQQPSGDELTGAQVAALPIADQLAWAAARARHRPLGGSIQ